MTVFTRILTIAAVLTMLAASTMESLPATLLGGLLIALAVFCGYLEERRKRHENQQKPITTVDATVLSHRTMRERVGRTTVIRYYISFKTAEGSRLEFSVSQMDFDDFDVGETGPLRYRGWEFLSFGVRDKSHIKPMAPLPEEYDLPQAQKGGTMSWWRTLADKWRAFQLKRTNAVQAEPEQQTPAKKDGVLTHELDE